MRALLPASLARMLKPEPGSKHALALTRLPGAQDKTRAFVLPAGNEETAERIRKKIPKLPPFSRRGGLLQCPLKALKALEDSSIGGR